MQNSDHSGTSPDVLKQILASGIATVRLDRAEAEQLTGLYRESAAFFALDAEKKFRYGVPNRNTGYFYRSVPVYFRADEGKPCGAHTPG